MYFIFNIPFFSVPYSICDLSMLDIKSPILVLHSANQSPRICDESSQSHLDRKVDSPLVINEPRINLTRGQIVGPN